MTVGANTCSDQTGPGDCDPFNIEKVNLEGGTFSQGVEGSYWSPWFKDYTADVFENLDNFPHLTSSFAGDQSNGVYATQAVARTNPSRPYVDVPLVLFELKDLIPLIRDAGRELFRGSLTNQVAQTNLFYQFGLAPLVGDTVKMLRFQDQVDRRVKELKRLRSKKGLRRTLSMGSFSETGQADKVYQSVGTYMVGTFYAKSSLDVRAHVRWLPGEDANVLLTPDRFRDLAQSTILGLRSVEASTVWNAIPWTWLIDWFSTAGDFLAAHRNSIPATLEGVHIIRRTTTVWSMGGGAFSDVVIHPVKVTRVTGSRAPSSVALSAQFPFLNGRQLGILASLATAGSNRTRLR
jgi:hypothetical protein